ncbi:MAG: molybdopterin-dependent oxidoreductase [Pseudomonadota bacterium]
MQDKNENMMTLKIDGKEVSVPRGSTILDAAIKAGVFIPTLCHDPRLKPFGACRMCVVQVEGRGPRFVTACSTPADPDTNVITTNERIDKARRTVLELLAVHHPVDCPVCDAAGECEFQNLTASLRGTDRRRFGGEEKRYVIDRRNPLVERNLARCIGCGKCVRVCTEVQGTAAIDFQHRGFETGIGPAFQEPLDCDFCGQCVDICPVGALQNRQYKYTTRSWLLNKVPAVCCFCGDGCSLEVGVGQRGEIVRAKSRAALGFNEGNLCQRGRFGHDVLTSPARINEPMIRKDGSLMAVGWKDAQAKAASELDRIKSKHGEGSVGFMVGGRVDNESLLVLSRFAGEVMKSGNIASTTMRRYRDWIDTAREVWGVAPPAMAPARALESDLILVLESEINATNPLTWINIRKAQMQREAALVVADSRRTKTGWRAGKFFAVAPGGSTELLLRVVASMVIKGLVDRGKLGAVEGFDKFTREASAAKSALTEGIEHTDVGWLANALAGAENPLIVLTLDSMENMKSKPLVRAAADLMVLLGKGPENIMVPMPEANMRGLVDSGLAAGEGARDAALFMKDISDGKIKALYVIGDDPLSRLPDPAAVEKALASLELLVVQDIVLGPTANMADIILPSAGWSEHEGSFTCSSGVIQAFDRAVNPVGEAEADWKIISGISARMGFDFGYKTVESIRKDYLEKWYPGKKILKPGLFSYAEPGPAGEAKEPATGKFIETGFKAAQATLIAKELQLQTGPMRGHSGVLSTYSAAITSVFGEPRALINPADAKALGVEDGGSVNVKSTAGDISVRVKVDHEIRKGVIFIPAHFSEPPVLSLVPPDAYAGGAPVKVTVTPFKLPARACEAAAASAVSSS